MSLKQGSNVVTLAFLGKKKKSHQHLGWIKGGTRVWLRKKKNPEGECSYNSPGRK